jgi:hypothetical protein
LTDTAHTPTIFCEIRFRRSNRLSYNRAGWWNLAG